MINKRVMVDMSATLIHQGHTRLITKAKEYGKVIIGLTTDEEILEKKGYSPELSFENRKEILESIKGVHEVVPVPWLINEEVLDNYRIDLLIHGDDNSNSISEERQQARQKVVEKMKKRAGSEVSGPYKQG